ncbi:Tuftelin-interacting protein 11 [Rhynchospora pubera]|uniref:Tuftelin-interacting protein 11 n=1 Tax=Rhynchospora pubera TaxID=906938 RepID=A0AAV8C986_9POAL|nr:Tuftelin-interacting protein 11 [Rhynchospora pubera]
MADGDEFEGGRWTNVGFYCKNKKERPVQSRDDAVYGVFATGGSSYSDSDTGRRRGKRRKGDVIGSKADLTKPAVQFVPPGTVRPSQEIEENDNANNKEEEKGSSSRGLGFGLGFHYGDTKEKERDDRMQDDEASLLRTEERAEQRKEERERLNSSKHATSRRDVTGGSDIGMFKAHIKGIGWKLLERMGYVAGHGLGKNEQGIVTPVEAKLRPKNMGLGFNDFKEPKLLDKPLSVSNKLPSSELWSKRRQGRKKGVILTMDDLLTKKQEEGAEVFQQKVIDMRGPQVRVLINLENLNSNEEKEQSDDIPMKELQYNIRVEIESTEADIQMKDRQLRREREKVQSLLEEKKVREKEEARQRKQLQTVQVIAGVLDRVQDDNGSGLLTLDSLLATFLDLKNKYGDDYKLCHLSVVACAYALPLLAQAFHGWDPLLNPSHGLEIMRAWRDLVQGDQPFEYADSTYAGTISPYTQLVSEVILPVVRLSSTNTWLVQDPEPMLRFLETWDRVLPPLVLQSILEHVILPKLAAGVDSWNPRSETVPIHVWVHPWLPLLGQRLETLYHIIQYKLGQVLHDWHASDASAYMILSPWKDVFPAANWERLMVNHIVLKLRLVLQEFEVNPSNQNLDQFNWVMMWANAIPVHHMVHLLEFGFFNKWHQVLYHWLCNKPDYNEVWNWYMGWKNLFPAELLANERIRVLMSTGLDMMNSAVDGNEVLQPSTTENVSYLRATERKQAEAMQQAGTSTSILDLSFKETIQAFASEQGIPLMPRVGKFHNGYQVYDFGAVGIYMFSSKRLLYAQAKDGIWSAVSLTQLMDMNRTVRRWR